MALGIYPEASERSDQYMFEHLNTPEEIFSFKLGSALSMEQKLVEVLGELEDQAQRPEIQQTLHTPRDVVSGAGEQTRDGPCRHSVPPPAASRSDSPTHGQRSLKGGRR